MDDLIKDFVVEATESLELVDVELVRFEASPGDRAALDRVFRLVHTLKGACGFLGLPRLEAIAHAAETLLGRFRDGLLEVTPEAVGAVLRAIDVIRSIVAGLETEGTEPQADDGELIGRLERLATAVPVSARAPVAAVAPERPLRPGEVSEADLEAAFLAAPGPDLIAQAPGPPNVAEETQEPAEPTGPEQGAAAQSIRVGVGVLEDMMTLVSELVLTRNQLLQINRTRTDEAYSPPLQRLSAITGELQDNVMKTRMQPIGQAWKKLPRLVRDLSRELGKKIDLQLEGETTELDRQILEQIRDPLTHMVRNSADHGLETPAERLAAGKPETGAIRLSAFHEGGSIVIRLRDDGRGLDTDRIREKAIERGLVGRSEAEALTDAQIHRLIFAPGFSTAQTITNVSGRGVGMDVVRSNIEQIGGQIELHSIFGQGCAVTVKIPLTLAIISALIVRAGGERFAFPQNAVLELVRVTGSTAHRFETIEKVRMLRLRDALVPLIDLAGELRMAEGGAADYVLIVKVGRHRFGVIVEEVIDTEEIVVKPLAAAVRHIGCFSGATILGDGSVVLIVDPNALSEKAGEIEDAGAESDLQWQVDPELDRKALLIVRAGSGAPKAVALEHVTRLERVPADAIERVHATAAVQYRGKLMPVLTLDATSDVRREGVQPLLVFSGELYAMGLAVDEIVDVVEAAVDIELAPTQPGIVGAAIIAGQATEIIDVDHYIFKGLAARYRLDNPAAEAIQEEAA